jgi:DnaJ-class molecular chaperone
MKNHYEVLGVSRDASPEDIKRSYRALSLKWHPDRNPSPESQSKFQEIGSAYEILSDESKRHEYNCELDGVQMGGQEVDLNDIIQMMFGQGFPGQGFPGQGFPGQGFPGQGFPGQGFPGMAEVRFEGGGPGIHVFHGHMPGMPGMPGMHPNHFFRQMQKPQPIIQQINLTFEQAYSGCTLCTNVDKWVVKNEIKVHESEQIYVNIPAGIDNNEIIIMRDCGNAVSAELKGDIKFVVQVSKSDTFERQGMDLVHKRQISLREALTGFSFELTHVNGKMLCLNNMKNRTIITPNYRKTIPNLGMIRDGNIGNLIIEFTVAFPESLTDEQTNRIAEILC